MVYKHKVAMEAPRSVSHCDPMANSEKSLTGMAEHVAPLTVQFSDCNLPGFMRIAANFGSDSYAYAVTPNVDHLIRFCDDAAFRELYRTAGFVLLDSRFLSYLLRVVAGLRLPTSPGSDVTAHLFDDVIAADDKIVVIGGTEEQAQILSRRYGLRALRHLNPPMGFINDPAAVEECLRFIESESPFRFCLLAVGCPQQEVLAKALQSRGRARGLALCVGASINFLTGGERRAPRWIQKSGFEWLYRLLNDPGRLAKRYLVRGPRIFLLLPRLKFTLRPASPFVSEIPRP
jgi:N-acetylglucosaminyldiphosphoundecaprenol N-acetyl-beta-D-mannosaminyltransferase